VLLFHNGILDCAIKEMALKEEVKESLPYMESEFEENHL
jgi:hypothetical protein